jgi:Leucine-rich repeat (LRR) protein
MTIVIGLSIPLLGYASSQRIAKKHVRVADKIAPYGQGVLAAELPTWLASRLPSVMHTAFLRLTSVELTDPPADLVDQVLQLRSLQAVSVADAQLVPRELQHLSHCRDLLEIAVDNCQFPADAINDISNQAQLWILSIRGCTLTPSELAQLNRLRNLTQVDLTDSRFKLSDFNQTGWAGCVRVLHLSHSRKDGAERLHLHDWMRLEQLSVRRGSKENDSAVELHLASCPALKSIYLEHNQKYSLFAHALPSLVNLVEPFDTMLMRATDYNRSNLPRWQCLNLTDVPRLKRVECNVSDLDKIKLSGVQRLREVAIGTDFVHPLHILDHAPNAYDQSQLWLTEVGQLSDLRCLSLDGIRIQPTELDRIAAMKSLRRLELTNCQLTSDDLNSIAQMQHLESIYLHRSQLDQQQLNQILDFPRLQTLAADLSQIRQFHIADDSRLEQIETLPMRNLESLKLENLPRFAANIIVQNSIQQILVSKVPCLVDITVECPWPQDFQLKALHELQRFASGGPNLNDHALQAILRCSNLDQLILAYPSLSKQTLRRLGRLESLTILEVPGCPVDDEVTSHWHPLKRLRRVNLDDTQVSAATAEWLRSIESLRSLSLNRVKLDRATCERLVSLRQLSEISLAGTPVAEKYVVRMLEFGNLDFLDLSGTQITDEVLKAIKSARNLKTVFLLEVPLEVEQVQQLLSKNPKLKLVGGLDENQFLELPEDLQSRVFVNLNQYNLKHGFERAHRVMLYSEEKVKGAEERVYVYRPFASEQFRD